MIRKLAIAAFAMLLAAPQAAFAEATTLRVAQQFGVAYMQFMVMEDQKLIEKHAKAAGLGDITVEFNQFRSSDVMNDALISGSVDFVSLGIPGLITIWSKTKGTIDVKASTGLNVSPLMLMVRDPAIKSLRDFKDNQKIAMPAVKVSMQAILLQMAAAKEFGIDKFNALDHLTVSMAHPAAFDQHRPGRRRSFVQRHRRHRQIPHAESEALRRVPVGAQGGDRFHQR